ncbi:hypothetical protein ACFP8W_11460, partial [Nocardioides hankookensis]
MSRDHHHPPSPTGLVGLITGRRTAWAVTLVSFVLAALALGVLGEGTHEQSPTDSAPRGADSTHAIELRDQLPQDDSSVAIVLYTADEGTLSDAQLADLRDQAERLGGAGDAELVPSKDGT